LIEDIKKEIQQDLPISSEQSEKVTEMCSLIFCKQILINQIFQELLLRDLVKKKYSLQLRLMIFDIIIENKIRFIST